MLLLSGDLGATNRDQAQKKQVDDAAKRETRPLRHSTEPRFCHRQIRDSPSSCSKQRGRTTPRSYTFQSIQTCDTQKRGWLCLRRDREGDVYVVRIHNDEKFDVAVSLHLDGVSMFVLCDEADPQTKLQFKDSKTKAPLFNHFVVPAGEFADIRGWFINLDFSEEFELLL